MPAPPEDWSEFITFDLDRYDLAPKSQALELVVEWAQRYCEKVGLSHCAGIPDRAVPLCIEKWDCHPAVLVPFEEGTAAFLSGGVIPQPQVVAVWRAETDPDLIPYGGARRLLEAYLLTALVCPDNGGSDPRGVTCPSM
ncbi:hypothetical protein [Microbacterium sp. SS28]|uniref:hypothetical protein n=1 Tax=Microbacterium sp. SS28 TaxID=2919948 RepID=UPI001FA9A277|nr:hypothetical protein [Microbacterium sp. SS28]